ncbi:hypothetical protein K2O51_31250 (plasmid) [Cupriavidus pinatubonensis]|uniref:hypothetical protein n=1 Tax=Cupriavidus pinatubonensis TaxID=248026 RepID=UPI001C737D4C|nr:hypothetical protein [Cupriavidus pinatubonensis]QYY33721.1 hypothetical protein K2O51_31250 [Cupriavidus pinatubonensis]
MQQNSNPARPAEGRAKSLLNDLLSSMDGRPQDRAMFTALFVEGKTSAEVRTDMNLTEQEYQDRHLAMMRRFRSGRQIAA